MKTRIPFAQRVTKIILIGFIILVGQLSRAETCAFSEEEVKTNAAFAKFVEFLKNDFSAGMLNQTNGSYVVFGAVDKNLSITLYSSGFFNLIPIRKQSAFKICVSGDELWAEAFGERNRIQFQDDNLIVGEGGAKYTFRLGSMPAHLRKIHGFSTL